MRLIKVVGIVAIFFVHTYALKYLLPSDATFGIYESRRDWLLVHVAAGTAALLFGPVQFWLILSRSKFSKRGQDRALLWHRILGIAYVMSVAFSSVSAIYLALHTDFGWVFRVGMITMASVWIITTGLAVTAVCRCLIQQHQEWMIRSYVVTFSFVSFRAIVEILEALKTGTMTEQYIVASWMCWSVPLVIVEVVIQIRKMFQAAELRDGDRSRWVARDRSPSLNSLNSAN